MEELINQSNRIFVAGHRGMAGSAICRALMRHGFSNIITVARDKLNLENQNDVQQWFDSVRPHVVVLAAAKVGGILANSQYPADFLLNNLKIQNNVIESSWKSGVQRFLFLGSSCIYPKYAPQPITESELLNGSLETTNESYALAKIAGIKLCQTLRSQYGFDAFSLMPTNLYGPGDNYHSTESHVLPALIRRFYEAKSLGISSVTCWGSGNPRREFLHVDDLAEACVFTLKYFSPGKDDLSLLNVGSGLDISIRELAALVSKATGYGGHIYWDTNKPDGTPQKLLDVTRLAHLGWKSSIPLSKGIEDTIELFSHQLHASEVRLG